MIDTITNDEADVFIACIVHAHNVTIVVGSLQVLALHPHLGKCDGIPEQLELAHQVEVGFIVRSACLA